VKQGIRFWVYFVSMKFNHNCVISTLLFSKSFCVYEFVLHLLALHEGRTNRVAVERVYVLL
jgi:hypothetical protein